MSLYGKDALDFIDQCTSSYAWVVALVDYFHQKHIVC
jgi:hypothetical protein